MELDDLIPSEKKQAQSKALNFDDLVPGVEAKEDKPFHERVKERYGERMQQLDERNALIPKTKEERGQKSSPLTLMSGGLVDYEKALNPLVAGAGIALDTVTEGLVSAGKGLSAITPDPIEDHLKDELKQSWDAIKDTPPIKAGLKALGKGGEWWKNYKKNNPGDASDIEGMLTLGLIAAPVKTKPRTQTGLGKLGEVAQTKGEAKTFAKRADFIHDLILPKKTPNVKADLAGRTDVSGLLQKKQVIPTDREKEIISEVNKIPGVRKNNLIQKNLNAIQESVSKENKKLEILVKAHDKQINLPTVSRELDAAGERLMKEPELVGDAVMTANKLVAKAKEIVNKNDPSLSGMLKARKEFDAYIAQRKPGVLDPKTESAMSSSVREVRQTLNEFIEQRVPDGQFKKSLRKQNNLLIAVDNIKPKAGFERDTAILRLMDKASKIGGLREKVGLAAYGATLAGTAVYAPQLAQALVAAGAVYGTKKAATSGAAFKGYGELINAMDEVISKQPTPKP